jgi:hypothetical protein
VVYWYTDNILVWASTELCLLKAWGDCIGTPPKGSRLKALKLGEWLKVKDGKIETGTFDVAWDYNYTYRNYNTTGASSDGGVTVTTYKADGTKSTKKVGSKTVDEWLKEKWEERWDQANLKELTEEIDSCRARTDEILKMDQGWWEDAKLLNEFNGLWDRIRALKDLYEDKVWEEINEAGERGEAPHEECTICGIFDNVADMVEDSAGELHCGDCWDFHVEDLATHNDLTLNATTGELQWKTIAPGTEVMVRVNPETGEELIG